jgi:hypothetical protein
MSPLSTVSVSIPQSDIFLLSSLLTSELVFKVQSTGHLHLVYLGCFLKSRGPQLQCKPLNQTLFNGWQDVLAA